jgi:hypothetical protein
MDNQRQSMERLSKPKNVSQNARPASSKSALEITRYLKIENIILNKEKKRKKKNGVIFI